MSAYFNTKFGKQILETCKKGTTTVIALYQKDLYNLPVPIPNEKLLKKIDKIYNNINKKSPKIFIKEIFRSTNKIT